jgi:hypothetical protein
MIDERLPDCRPPRRDPRLELASAHPELITGDLAMRPGIDVPPRRTGSAALRNRSRWAIGAVVLAMMAAFTLPALNRDSEGGFEARTWAREFTATCAPWDAAASEAIMQLVRGGSDTDLRQVGDAIVRIRRARRLCETGWVRLACLDYDAVIRGAPFFEQSTSVPSMCWAAILDPPADIMTRR